MNEAADTGDRHQADRAGLHEILGYGARATRIVNLLIRHGVATPCDLEKATHNELLDTPGIGQKSLDHIVASLEYVNRTRKEGR